MTQRKKTSKPKQAPGVAKGREVIPVKKGRELIPVKKGKEELPVKKGKEVSKEIEQDRSIPIGMPVSKEKFDELKKKARKKD